ncbi:hypothetical protein Patl_1306 [Paraglaciecola sp. T6c]|uniref:hypothetical protein n=1 Tax=Pseudoalteromonas atlantica (strain T6c / ATCC BAA-1087) TaxID=3042615 RepID=UPI00005C60B4|nr:hypothetical protein [Paraglaciecola sp. T6c]ABG39832.1 hypothetical protein Patl_1306 [Paraglaciecola sp. T6c]
MKYANKFKKAAPLLLLPIMGVASATDVTVPLSFTTLPVIEIEEIQPLAFGDVLTLAQAATCTMSTNAGTALTPAQEGSDLTSAAIFGTGALLANSAGELSNGCDGDDGQVGIYKITSFADADITVSLSSGTDSEINFVPAGYVTDLVEGAPGTPARTPIANGGDVDVNASAATTAFGAAGTNRAIIGGTITNFAPLTAGGQYATDFNLNVVYQ